MLNLLHEAYLLMAPQEILNLGQEWYVSREAHKLHCAMQFGFKDTNNVAEYEALLVGLRLAMEMQIKKLVINSDSQLVIARFMAISQLGTVTYLKLVMEFV